MDLGEWGKVAVTILVPVLTAIGIGSRRRFLRAEIRDNLELVKLLGDDEILTSHTPARGWLRGKIAVDVARLAGQRLGNPKKPIPWATVIVSAVLVVVFGGWTYLLDFTGFQWYSIFPALIAILLLMAIAGSFMNRELPSREGLPEGATPIRSGTAEEEVVSTVQLASSEANPEMFADDGQVGVVLRFIQLMREKQYDAALLLTDSVWQECRIQSWLWNNRSIYGDDAALNRLTQSLLTTRQPAQVWDVYSASETEAFSAAWAELTPDRLGAASRRRRVSRDCDAVIVVPLGDTGGYFVMTATAIPNALTFLVRQTDAGWVIANHLVFAIPDPGLPPTWWNLNDSAVESLPSRGQA